MSFTKEKREQIKLYILEKMNDNQCNLITSVAQKCDISATTVQRYIKQLLEEGIIEECDKNCRYQIVNTADRSFDFKTRNQDLEEQQIFDEYIRPLLNNLPQNVQKIWEYVFTEIMNNAIEHSEANHIKINFVRNKLFTTITIFDDGVGIFNRIRAYINERDQREYTSDDAVTMLFAGKLTTNEACHSGEGIFFSSRAVDSFIIFSSNRFFTHDRFEAEDKWNLESMEDSQVKDNLLNKKGTCAIMELRNDSKKILGDIFDMYSDQDLGFYKTQIPLKNMITSGFAVSRSQARRIVASFEKFKEVELNFDGIDEVSQAFAHEMFVVFQKNHPDIELVIKNANDLVMKMINRVKNTV